jgi:hypothetical protein
VGFVDSFIDEYIGGLRTIQDRAQFVFRECFEKVGISTIDNRYTLLREPIKLLEDFSDAKSKIETLRSNLAQVENVIQNFTLDINKTRNFFEPIKKEVDDIINHFNGALQSINNEIERIFKNINESLYGKPEYGKIFENLVLSLFDVMFIHELVREEPPKLKQRGIKLDGFYNKLDAFDARGRTGFEFQKMLIECKNKRPDINDLMQCFKYTLCFQTTEISRIPLTLLVCRNAPGKNSSIWEINKRIFDKQIASETRLILILTMDDLREMKELKLNGRDPAKVIKDEINSF